MSDAHEKLALGAYNILNPLWVFSLGIEANWKWIDGVGRETNVASVQDERYREAKSLSLMLEAPGSLGESVTASVQIFDADNNLVAPPPGYPPTEIELQMKRGSDDPEDPNYNRYFIDQNQRIMVTRRSTTEVAELGVPSDVIAMFDPGTFVKGRLSDAQRDVILASANTAFLDETPAEAIVVEEAIFPRGRDLVFDGQGQVRELLDDAIFSSAEDAHFWNPNIIPAAGAFRGIEYRYWPALGERKLSLRLKSERFVDAQNIFQFPRFVLVAELAEGAESGVQISYNGQTFFLTPGGAPFKRELFFLDGDPQVDKYLWQEWRFSASEPDAEEVQIVWRLEDERGIPVAGIDPTTIWIGSNLVADGPAGDRFKHVSNGEDLLVAENNPVASEAVRELQEIFNDVLPRKRRYCVGDVVKGTEERLPAFLDEGGNFTDAGAGSLGAALRLLAREFRKVSFDGSVFDCEDDGKMGLYEAGSSSEFTTVTENPWIYQVHPTLRSYLKQVYGLNDNQIDGRVVDRWLLVGDTPLFTTLPDALIPVGSEGFRDAVDGVLELKENVLDRFTEQMFSAGQAYLDLDNPWVPRRGQPEQPEQSGQPAGTPYSFGGRQSAAEIDQFLANCAVPDDAPGNSNFGLCVPSGGGSDPNTCIDPDYSGDLDASCNVGGGTGRYAGLFASELGQWLEPCQQQCLEDHYPEAQCGSLTADSLVLDPSCSKDAYESCINSCEFTDPTRVFNKDFWSGVDCSGFQTNLLHQATVSLTDELVQLDRIPVETGEIEFDQDRVRFWWAAATYFDRAANDKTMAYWVPAVGAAAIGKMRPGDYLIYQSKRTQSIIHNSLYFSGPGGEAEPDCTSGTCRYRILHASGDHTVQFLPDGAVTPRFNRKVVINSIGTERAEDDFYDAERSVLPTPIGFGRIKLWD